MKTQIFQHRKWYAVVLFMLTIFTNNAWGQVASATATDGGTYVIAAYYNSKYYALPNNTSAGTWAGTEVSVNGSGQVTTENAPTWTLVEGSTAGQFYLTYKSGNSTYYLYKNGTSTSNYNIKGSTSSSERNYWAFTAGTGQNAGKYQVLAVGRGSNHTCLTNYSSSTFRVRGTSGYNIILLPVATTPAYTITATSNNNSWGTVSVSGTTITATPADCYQVVSGTGGYTVTSGTATVSHTGTSNTLTVTPSTNCTVQVNFEKKTVNTYIDEIQDNGEIEDCSTEAPSLSDKAAATSGTCAQQHYHFVGWVTAANKANPTDANIIEAGETVAVNGTTYYAVWAKGSGGGSFDGTNGGTFKIYANVNGTNHYMLNTVTSNRINSTTTAGDAFSFTLSPVDDDGTTKFTISYDDNGTEKYIYHAGTNTANVSIGTTSSLWEIVGGTNGTWRVKTGYSTRSLIYRAGSTNQFAGYANSNATSTSSEYYDLEIGGATSYSDYITTCCNALGQINGSVNSTNYKHLYFSIITLNIMLLQMNKHVKYRFYPLF